MVFRAGKLTKNAAQWLVRISSAELVPYALLYTPLYLYLERNQKFIPIKGPLDGLTPEMIEKLASKDQIYVHPDIKRINEARQVASDIKKANESSAEFLAPFEVSDFVLKKMGKLFLPGAVIESLSLIAFSERIWKNFSREQFEFIQQHNDDDFKTNLFKASVATILMILLGRSSSIYLNKICNYFLWNKKTDVTHDSWFFAVLQTVTNLDITLKLKISDLLVSNEFLHQRLSNRVTRLENDLIDQVETRPEYSFVSTGIVEDTVGI